MKIPKTSLKLVFLLVCILVVGATTAAAHPSLSSRTPVGIPPTSTLTVPQGTPAITPSLRGVPSFTANDVQAYLQKHPLLPSATSVDGSFTVNNISFLSSSEVSRLLAGESTGYASNALLCYVQVSGDFLFSSPPDTQLEYTQGFIIFDAQTGNLVISGGSAQATGTKAASHLSTTRALASAPSASTISLLTLEQPLKTQLPATTYNCFNPHCYGVMAWPQKQFVQSLAGGGVFISYAPLQGGNGFVDNEMWLVQSNNPNCINQVLGIGPMCWVETGMVAGPAYGFNTPHYFWADNRPTANVGIFTFHDMGVVPAADQDPANPPLFGITQDATSTFSVDIIGSAPISAASTNNAMVPDILEMGQELYGSTGATSIAPATYSGISHDFHNGSSIAGLPVLVMPSKSIENSPPFTKWLTLPQLFPQIGASFETLCC